MMKLSTIPSNSFATLFTPQQQLRKHHIYQPCPSTPPTTVNHREEAAVHGGGYANVRLSFPMTNPNKILLAVIVLCPYLVLPTVFMYAFLILLLRFRYRQRTPQSVDPRMSYVDMVSLDKLDEEFDGLPTTPAAEVVRIRYDRVRALAGRAQTLLGDVARRWGKYPSGCDCSLPLPGAPHHVHVRVLDFAPEVPLPAEDAAERGSEDVYVDMVSLDELDEEFDEFLTTRAVEVVRIRYDRVQTLVGGRKRCWVTWRHWIKRRRVWTRSKLQK
ncbi:hypothetical protein Fmac_027333 [Flemingia macrophylla]|uniref:Multiple C2 domain-containing protein n=1 Tax=Flemingia macrophylla TaxID=520843 RepID=A0ABD1LHF1_9FABA